MYNIVMLKYSRGKFNNKAPHSTSLIVKTFLLTLGAMVLVLCFLFGASVYINKNKVADSAIEASISHASAIPEITAEPTAGPTLAPTVTDNADTIHVSDYFTIVLGDENAAVANLQMRLMELGYLDYDEPSNTFNAATQAAVMLFQRAQGKKMTGIADSALQELLFSEDAPSYQVRLSDSGSDIRSMQSRLHELGYYADRVSGYFGPKTEASVMMFQMQNGMPANGVFSYADWQLLYSSEAVAATVFEEITPTPTATAPSKNTPKPTSSSTRTPRPTTSPSQSTPKPSVTGSDGIPIIGGDVTPTPTPKPSGGGGSYSYGANGVIACAKDQMGKSYVWGDEGPNTFDCSGLVYYCLRSCGVSVSRLSAKSYSQKSSWTLVSSIDDLQEGDLIFFKSDSSESVNHAAIYIGGSRFIHASSSAGEVVRSSFSSDSSKYWNRNFVCGRRVFG